MDAKNALYLQSKHYNSKVQVNALKENFTSIKHGIKSTFFPLFVVYFNQLLGAAFACQPAFACRPALRSKQISLFCQFSDIFVDFRLEITGKGLKRTKKVENS